ncbi:hypothetical protein ACSVH2_06955 [Flavobacterium sp. RSB2_4_14]|uniref:hypothetical protein n=1 Tax=Flavobacterium sp. RSB2_4_14 TaxID=3447665 RepID=UPI003F3FAEEE
MRNINFVILLLLLTGFTKIVAQADAKENVAIIKKNLADSKEALKKYEWIETTTTFYKGESKGVKQKQCYYAVDGKLTKVETGGSTQEKAKGGIRGKVAANKKEDITEYMKKAVAKIQTYLPPNPDKIQAIYASGAVSIQVLEPNKKFKLNFPNYNEKGDMLSVTLNKETKKLKAIDVSTTVEGSKEKAVFNVTYKDLPDGTQFAETTTLDAKEKSVKIVIKNSGYKKGSGQ